MKLSIQKFGRFTNKEFSLGDVTVFSGPNESGKTTILDALVQAIFGFSGNSGYRNRLKQRYGDDSERLVQLEGHTSKTLPEKVLLGSFVLREGAMEFNPNDVFPAIESSLFDDGINPKSLKKQLDEFLSTKKSVTAEKRRIEARDALTLAQKEREKAEEELKTYSKSFESLPHKQKQKAELETRKKENLQKKQTWEAERNQLKKKEKFFLDHKLYSDLLVFEDLESKKPFMSSFLAKSYDKKIRELEQTILSLKELGISREIQIEEQKKKLFQIQNGITEAERDTKIWTEKKDWVVSASARYQSALSQVSTKTLKTLKPIRVRFAITSGLVSVISAIVGLSIPEPVLYLVSFIFGALGLGIYVNRWENTITIDESQKWEIITSIKSEYKTKFADDSIDLSLQTNQLEAKMQSILQTSVQKESYLQHLKSNEAELIKNIDNATTVFSRDEKRLNEVKQELSDLFLEAGCLDFDSLQKKVNSFQSDLSSLDSLTKVLTETAKQRSYKDIRELKMFLKDSVREMEELGILPQFSPEENAKSKQLEQSLVKLQEEIQADELEIQVLETKIQETQRYGNEILVPAQIRWEKTQKNWEAKKKVVEQNELEFEAGKVLSRVFDEMEEDTATQMEVLFHSLQNRINEMLKQTKTPTRILKDIRLVETGPLSNAKSAVGNSLEHLSTGAREQIYFALRLEYLFRIGKENQVRFLLLDEPFRHMDNERKIAALTYCLESIQKEKFRLVLFTFDEDFVLDIKNLASKIGLTCQVHPLLT